jgi:hypothetical protein
MKFLHVGLKVNARPLLNNFSHISLKDSYPKCGQEWSEDDSSDVSESQIACEWYSSKK